MKVISNSRSNHGWTEIDYLMSKPAPSPVMTKLVNYTASFAGGFASGITGELVTLCQNKKLNFEGLTSNAFSDNVIISGAQMVAKDASKDILKKMSVFSKMSTENPLLFGAATGLPMWALTRIVGSPLQNSHKKDAKPFDGYCKSVKDDFAYHTVKNALDEYCGVNIFPTVLPKLDGILTKRIVEGTIAGIVGAGSHILAFPVKSRLAGQTLPMAFSACEKTFMKVAVKKVTYSIARPRALKLLQ